MRVLPMQGDGTACTWLAGLRLEGKGVAADPNRAAQLFFKGCELKHGFSCRVLGDFLNTGHFGGGPGQAFTAFHMGCFRSDPPDAEVRSSSDTATGYPLPSPAPIYPSIRKLPIQRLDLTRALVGSGVLQGCADVPSK